MFILKKGHQPGVYVPLRALFLVFYRIIYLQGSWGLPNRTPVCGLGLQFFLEIYQNHYVGL